MHTSLSNKYCLQRNNFEMYFIVKWLEKENIKYADIPPVSVFIMQSNSETSESCFTSLLVMFSLTMFWFFIEVCLAFIEILYFMNWCHKYVWQFEHCSFFRNRKHLLDYILIYWKYKIYSKESIQRKHRQFLF